MRAAAIWLQTLGFLFEFCGIVVAVLDIRYRSRSLTSFEESQRHRNIYVSDSATITSKVTGSLGGGRTPTLEERLALVEKAVNQLPDVIEERAKAAAERARDDAVRHADDLRQMSTEELAKVKVALREALSGSRRALFGVWLLVLGLVLQAMGTIAGTVSS